MPYRNADRNPGRWMLHQDHTTGGKLHELHFVIGFEGCRRMSSLKSKVAACHPSSNTTVGEHSNTRLKYPAAFRWLSCVVGSLQRMHRSEDFAAASSAGGSEVGGSKASLVSKCSGHRQIIQHLSTSAMNSLGAERCILALMQTAVLIGIVISYMRSLPGIAAGLR